MSLSISRRSLLKSAAALGAASLTPGALRGKDAAAMPLRYNIHPSVCRWCYSGLSLEALCAGAKRIGLESVELLDPDEWQIAFDHGLTCAMTNSATRDGLGGIPKGFNRLEHHDALVAANEELIGAAAKAGLRQVICFSGNRDGLDDESGLAHCAAGLKRLMSLCERQGVTLVMELLNSKVNHPDYQCDHTAWGVELCERVGSERFKLLYDIYHMQIMEGDIIATIREAHPYIAHYHTGGVPGRHEIDDSQELNYPAIMRAIVETGFTGFVGQEFIPEREPLESLAEGVRICDV